jgi:DNA processing protein
MQYNEVDYVVALLRNRSTSVSYSDVVENIFNSLGARAAWEHGDQGTLVADPVREQALHDAAAEVRTWLSRGWNVTSFLDEDYPQQLRDIHEMPPVLWSRGGVGAAVMGIASC